MGEDSGGQETLKQVRMLQVDGWPLMRRFLGPATNSRPNRTSTASVCY
jgi:hypothetical protein